MTAKIGLSPISKGQSMTRLAGVLVTMLALCLVWSDATAQDVKKGKVDVEAIFKKLDTNNDGKLQRDEFLKMADSFKNKEKAREKLTNTFAMIDADKKGFLSREQFRVYLDSAKKKN